MENYGIEMNFVTSWSEWDKLGCDAYYFYNVCLKPDVFPFPIKEGVVYDMAVDCERSVIEVYAVEEQDAPIFTSKFKAVFI